MFGNQQNKSSLAEYSGIVGSASNKLAGYANPVEPPPPPGIATRVQDLQTVALETRHLAAQIAGTLGLGRPSQEPSQTAVQPSLADVLIGLRDTLNDANRDLTQAIQHINS